eukprot:GHVN01020746.1.p2 GENE.GHVN01020746.1~~GHVN01020746.1.p2  ORF type:complete len:114 (+),score=6.00 GHVN01020746.1:316-657(+)
MFIVPVPTTSGYYNLVLQFQDGKHVLFTTSEEFQRNSTNAIPVFIVTFFDELAAEKDLVLFRGDVIQPFLELSTARFLLDYIERFYTEPDKFQWVERFNHNPSEFNFDLFRKL